MTPDDIDKWFRANFSGGPVAQQTAAYNQVFTAVQKLKALATAEAAAEQPAAKAD